MRAIRLLFALGALAAATAVPAADPPTKADYKKATDNLKQIALAVHNYEAAYGHFPGNIEDKDGKPLLSWRVAILAYFENNPSDDLYKQFKLNEPWDSDHNKKLIEKLPNVYAPVRAKAKAGETFYQRFSGKGTPLFPKQRFKVTDITDGTVNTGLVFEANSPVLWTKPSDLPFDPNRLPPLGAEFDGACHVAMADGSVIRLKKDADTTELKKLIQHADGDLVDLAKLTK